MELNREKLKRMFEDTKGNGGSANGGGGGGSLAGYATQAWVNEGFVSIDFFNRLFTVYGPGETSSDPDVVIEPNDLDSTIKNIEAMFGFWTEYYVSAMGNGGDLGSTLYLSSLADVALTSPISDGQVLQYNLSTGKWTNATLNLGSLTLSGLSDVLLSTPSANQVLLYDGTSSKWINSALKTINGQPIYGSGDISVGGGASGNYLPLAGGTMVGTINSQNIIPKTNNTYRLGTQGIGYQVISVYYVNSPSNAPLDISSNWGSGDIYIDTNHNVGIGTTTPSNKFHVNGVIYSNTSIISQDLRLEEGNEFNSYSTGSRIHINYRRSGDVTVCYGGGNVGIGTTNISYKLHVSGTIYATGAITALSDARQKDITGEAGITVEQIAHAPAVQFLWKDKERRKDGQQVGTLAQYWQGVLPEVVMDKGGELSMQYGVAAMVSAIVTARKVVDHERRIADLERENKELEVRLRRLNRYGKQ